MAAVNTSVISMRSVFDLCGYMPHQGQRPLHRSTARHRWGAMGRRLGKSHAGGHEATVEAVRAEDMAQHLLDNGKRNEVWIVGPEYTDAEKEFRVLWNDARRLELPLDKPGSYYNDHGDMIMSLWGGALRIQGKSAKYPSTLVGESLAGVILSEAAKLKESVWTKYIRPTLADTRGWSIAWSTPEGKNWFYRNWQKGQDESVPDWESWRMPSWFNDVVFPGGKDDPEIIDMCADMSEQKALQEIHASFTDFVGRVFKDFDEEVHVRRVPYDPSLPIYICCDFGWRNPFVMLAIQVDVWDQVRVIGEYRATEKDINDIADDLAEYAMFRNAVMLYPDPADPSSAQILGKKLRVPINSDTGGEKKFRLEYIRAGLKQVPEHLEDGHPEKQPKLVFDRSCQGTAYEMSEYRYPETKDEMRPEKEEPMDFDDHGPEALGRFYRGYYGPPVGPETMGRARVAGSRLSGRDRRRAA